MSKPNIKNLSFEELTQYLHSINERSFRTDQIFEWIYKKSATSFDQMFNLSSKLRHRLKQDFDFACLKFDDCGVASDHTKKILVDLNDKESIETVIIPTATRTTVCVSTQVGCKFGCRFCASGIGGWRRDLSCAEILDQILHVKTLAKGKSLSHIVFMGVGEPLDNYENLLKAIRIINSPKGLSIAARRITISTCGLIPKIRQLAKEGLQVELAVSLHGSDDHSRNVLMPVNKKYPVTELIKVCQEYNQATKRQITFEYILIKDVTCTIKNAQQLGRLLKGLICKINLIPYNKVDEFDHETPSREEMVTFRKFLKNQGVHATIRSPRGRDVAAACGQLRHTVKKKN